MRKQIFILCIITLISLASCARASITEQAYYPMSLTSETNNTCTSLLDKLPGINSSIAKDMCAIGTSEPECLSKVTEQSTEYLGCQLLHTKHHCRHSLTHHLKGDFNVCTSEAAEHALLEMLSHVA